MEAVSFAEFSYVILRVVFATSLLAFAAATLLLARRAWLMLEAAGAPLALGSLSAPPAHPPAGSVDAPAARLTLLEAAPVDGPPGRVMLLTPGLTIGRRPGCGLILCDDAVSSEHARLDVRDGRWVVADLGSTNGTYVNGRRLDAPAALLPGDVLTAGAASWRFDVARGEAR